ncbi:class I SAM-dependent methyltransferase [Shewanella sp. Isolate11]|uniref:class I SAM-dependent methyltransferase n=1 Tax=Shewanella sp. Isolate11 TaxID=2908530 RepID=UPI001EFE9A63|nr:class I SAM-dependent methyltransferase [Shewanella sp. Isolate11]MCG9696252.1 class I SAM-dependent methyltransferase [Shewanella sp. Isolate11]
MSQHWDEYWQQGHLTSFGESFTGNYSGVLQTVWIEEFEKLPEAFKLLDLATGNGALPLLVNQYFKGKDKRGRVDGVDLAVINTDLSKQLLAEEVSLELKSSIDCCQLPFASETYDLVMSQYGIEYSDLSRSIPEALRVLKPQGRLVIVTHHHKSMIIIRNQNILTLVSSKEVDEVFNVLVELINSMGHISDSKALEAIKNDPACEQIRKRLNTLVAALAARDESALKDSELLSYIMAIFKQGLFWTVEQKLQYVDYAKNQIATLKHRLTELASAALSNDDTLKLKSLFSHNGATIEGVTPVEDSDKQLLAWRISAIKNA